MRRLADLLSRDLGYIRGKREAGPNGDKKTFLNVSRTFLRALGKDLGLRDMKVTATPNGVAVSGDCTLMGMWEETGLYICIGQSCSSREHVLYYRAIRNIRDYTGGHNRYISRSELARLDYGQLLDRLSALRKGGAFCGRAA